MAKTIELLSPFNFDPAVKTILMNNLLQCTQLFFKLIFYIYSLGKDEHSITPIAVIFAVDFLDNSFPI
jgi:hypothetical protein